MRTATIALAVALLAGCAATSTASGARGRIITEARESSSWSDEERAQNVTVRNLRRSAEASFHLMRVRSEQPLHVHDESDLVLVSVAGGFGLTLGDRALTLGPGDVVEIPRGTPYALKNEATDASVAYLVFTPALQPEDFKSVSGPPKRESAWQWNLWVQ